MNKHTAGPWRVERRGEDEALEIWAGGTAIAALTYINGPEEADAALMAAAPDLAEAVTNFLRVWDTDWGTSMAAVNAVDRLRAALPAPAREGE